MRAAIACKPAARRPAGLEPLATRIARRVLHATGTRLIYHANAHTSPSWRPPSGLRGRRSSEGDCGFKAHQWGSVGAAWRRVFTLPALRCDEGWVWVIHQGSCAVRPLAFTYSAAVAAGSGKIL